MNIKRIWKMFKRHRHSFRHGSTHCNFRRKKTFVLPVTHDGRYLLKKGIKLEGHRKVGIYSFLTNQKQKSIFLVVC